MRPIRSIKINGREVRTITSMGGVIYSKPMDYEVLEYLESTGTQWVTTTIVPNNSTEAYCRFGVSSVTQPMRYPRVYGTQTTGDGKDCFIVCVYNNSTIHASTRTNDGVLMTSSITPSVGAIYETWLSFNRFRIKVLNTDIDQTITANTTTFPPVTAPFCLFAGNYPGKSEQVNFAGRIYEFCADGHRIIPVRRVADGVLGMYDLKTETFLANQGTGNFIAGAPTGRYY